MMAVCIRLSLCVCLCMYPQCVRVLQRNRMMPSSRELAANIWLTNDDVNTWPHKSINQISPYKLIEFTVDG